MSVKNNGTLIGNLAADPETRAVGGGTTVARFRLAVDAYNPSTKSREADFIPVVVFGKTAEFAVKYLKKGTSVAVRFHLKPRTWADRNGEKKWELSVIGDEVEFAGAKAAGAAPEHKPELGWEEDTENEADDGLSFIS